MEAIWRCLVVARYGQSVVPWLYFLLRIILFFIFIYLFISSFFCFFIYLFFSFFEGGTYVYTFELPIIGLFFFSHAVQLAFAGLYFIDT